MSDLFRNLKENRFLPIILINLYLLSHLIIRLTISDTIQVDDIEQLIYAQELYLGYPFPQPPMYSWLSWGAFQIFGPNLIALSVLKYLIISTIFFLIWKVAREITVEKIVVHIVLFSYLLMPSFFWHMHQGFTHTLLLSLGIIATVHSLLLLEKRQDSISYIYFGFSLSIGIMGKYSFVLFLIPLFSSILFIKEFRKLFLNPKILLSFGVLILIAFPHLYWFLGNYHTISAEISNRLNISDEVNYIETQIKIFSAYLGFIFPLILFSMPFYKFAEKHNLNKYQKLTTYFFIFVLVFSIIFPIFSSIENIKVRWLHPLMILFPIWIGTLISNNKPNKRITRTFNLSILILVVFVFTIRILQAEVAPKFDIYPRVSVPIKATIQKIPEEIFLQKNIFTDDREIAAHALAVFKKKAIFYNDKVLNKKNILDGNKCVYLSINPFKNASKFSFYSKYGNRKYEIFVDKNYNCL